MNLTRKLDLLTLVCVVSIAVNVVGAAWCVLVYFRPTFVQFQAYVVRGQQIQHVLELVRQEQELLETDRPDAASIREMSDLAAAITAELAAVADGAADDPARAGWTKIEEAVSANQRMSQDRLSALERGEPIIPTSSAERAVVDELERWLFITGNIVGQQRQTYVERAAATQQQVLILLVATAACAGTVCVAGFLLVRNWIVLPLNILRDTIAKISAGDLNARVQVRRDDELGLLAREVNHMSSSLMVMQSRMMARERLAAAGAMLRNVIHNVRTPLLGIRWLAEVLPAETDRSLKTTASRQAIIGKVDELTDWLEGIQQSLVSPQLETEPVRAEDLLSGLSAKLAPELASRGTKVDAEVAPGLGTVHVDRKELEAALSILLTHAAQDSPEHHTLHVRAEPVETAPALWRLLLKDPGASVVTALGDRPSVVSLAVETGGNNADLARATKVINAHGGQLGLDSRSGERQWLEVVLPRLAME